MSAYQDPATVSGRVHFPALDGLRGMAALAVLVLHLPPLSGFVFHAYLAVDLFFIMSGFVIAHAYEERLLGGWSPGAFISGPRHTPLASLSARNDDRCRGLRNGRR